MTFVEKDNPGVMYAYLIQSEGGLIEIGLCPVIFGWRVRAGFSGRMYTEIDWCCGDDQVRVEYAFSAIKAILEKRSEDANSFDGVPQFSKIKPYFNDVDFLAYLTSLGTFPLVKLPNIHELRSRYYIKHQL